LVRQCRLSVCLSIGVRARRLGEPHSGKTIIFWAKAKFFRQKPAAKNGKILFLYLLNEKRELILASEIKCPKSGIFLLIITVWGELGKVILQVSIAVFLGAVQKFWGQRWLLITLTSCLIDYLMG